MSKHAYLIISRSVNDQLLRQIRLLDSDLCDIFIHIDKKYGEFDSSILLSEAIHSNVFVFSDVKVFWGGSSQIKVELFLIKRALEKSDYSYFHLLSESDLPLYPANILYDFFESSGKEFIHFKNKQIAKKDLERVIYYYPMVNSKFVNTVVVKIIRKILFCLQKILRINRIKNTKIEFQKGTNWSSITRKFANYVVDNFDHYEKYF